MLDRLAAFTKLIRPVNSIMMGFAVIVGAALAARAAVFQQSQNLVLGFITGFSLTGAAMAINDYYDRGIDAINEPKRPIPSGKVTPKETLSFALCMTIIGLVAALVTSPIPNWQCLVIAVVSWTIVVLYVTKGKSTGLPGNLLVSTCITIPFAYGSFVIGRGLLVTTGVFLALVFLSNTGREITKGIVDLQGDKESNIKTVAVLYGERNAAVVAVIFYLSAVSLTPLPWLVEIVTFWYLPFVILTDIGLILASISLLSNYSRENARRIKNRNLFWFFVALLAFLAGTF
ncbi:MAG: UbiA family prenyltransferase [Candidatus Bathyarchaeota archaeon]|nr:MAG: UbiA family prenyltransferase [Candidatus Bathyarchaeota archaeon]